METLLDDLKLGISKVKIGYRIDTIDVFDPSCRNFFSGHFKTQDIFCFGNIFPAPFVKSRKFDLEIDFFKDKTP